MISTNCFDRQKVHCEWLQLHMQRLRSWSTGAPCAPRLPAAPQQPWNTLDSSLLECDFRAHSTPIHRNTILSARLCVHALWLATCIPTRPGVVPTQCTSQFDAARVRTSATQENYKTCTYRKPSLMRVTHEHASPQQKDHSMCLDQMRLASLYTRAHSVFIGPSLHPAVFMAVFDLPHHLLA